MTAVHATPVLALPGNADGVHPYADLANAGRLAATHAPSLQYVKEWGWLWFDGCRWVRGAEDAALRAAEDTACQMLRAAAEFPDKDEQKKAVAWAIQSQGLTRLKATLELAAADPRVRTSLEAFDQDPMLLNVQNGTVDLGTGRLRTHAARDRITRLAPVTYDAKATCPRWLAFLDRIFASQADTIAYVQRMIGYSLTGDTSEHVLFLCWGLGANGKTTLIEVLLALLGDYALSTPFKTFLEQPYESGANNAIARLAGARLVTSSESADGRRLAEGRLKALTGGDRIAARFLYREEFEFTPRCKLWLVSNHKPLVDGLDEGFWRRMRLIPFTVTIPEAERDKGLSAALAAELPGILNWALEGCRLWQANGLGWCTAVRLATEVYRTESDTLAEFLEERCVLEPGATVAVGELHRAYSAWAEGRGDRKLSTKRLSHLLTQRGIADARTMRERVRVGIRLRQEGE